MKLILLGVGVLLFAPMFAWMVVRPSTRILPLFAGAVPIASAFKLSVPVPAPFNTISSLFGALAVAAGLLHLLLYRDGRVPSWPMVLWLTFLGWVTLTVWWSADPADTASTLTLAFSLLILLGVVAFLRFEAVDVDVLRVAIIVGGAAVGIYALYLILQGASLPTHGVSTRLSIKSSAQDANPNILAASLLLPIVISTERFLLGGHRWWRARTWRALGGIGAGLSILAITLTGSRGGVFSALVAVTFTFVFARQTSEGRTAVKRILLSLGAAMLSLAVPFVILQGVFSLDPLETVRPVLSRFSERGTNLSGRSEIWQAALLSCEIHCATGVGLGNFPAAYNEVFALTGTSRNVGFDRTAHNIYILLALETGVVGLTLFLFAVAAEWIVASRARFVGHSPGLRAALLAVLVANVFLDSIWFKYFWLVFVMIRVVEGAAEQSSLPRRPVSGIN